MYETPNMGIVLEPKSLQTKEQLVGHKVFFVKVRTKREMWTMGLQKFLGCRK
jgi:hypothetical protein